MGQPYTPREYVVIESGEEGDPIRLTDITIRPKHPLDESCFVWCAYREAWLGKGKSIRTLDWKLNVYANGEGELYDLRNDPYELNNVWSDPVHGETRIDLERKLLQWAIAKEDPAPRNDTVKLSYYKKLEQAREDLQGE